MNVKGFSLGEVIRSGWDKFKENWFFLLSYLVLVNVICTGGYFYALSIAQSAPKTSTLIQLFLLVLNMVFSMGLVKALLTIADGEKNSWNCIYNQFPLLLKYFFASLFYVIVVMVGLLLFIIPGLIWAVKYLFFPYTVIDKKLGPLKALDESARITNGAKWDIAGWGLTFTSIIYFAIMILLIVPALIAVTVFNVPQEALLTTQTSLGLYVFVGIGFLIGLFSLFVSLMMAYIYRKLERLSVNE